MKSFKFFQGNLSFSFSLIQTNFSLTCKKMLPMKESGFKTFTSPLVKLQITTTPF